MPTVNVTEFRNRLPYYLRQVRSGVQLHITCHGKNIAQLIPEPDEVEAARDRLGQLRGTMIIGDIIEPVAAEQWSADADNL